MNNRPYFCDTKKIVWHPHQKYTYSQYMDALNSVFSSLFFESATTRFNLLGSYRMNLKLMVLYAIENDIDELVYIRSLRDILLKDAKCFDLQRQS